jgi:hypothetical protein
MRGAARSLVLVSLVSLAVACSGHKDFTREEGARILSVSSSAIVTAHLRGIGIVAPLEPSSGKNAAATPQDRGAPENDSTETVILVRSI